MPEGVTLCVETILMEGYMSMELTFCRVSQPPKSRILVPTCMALAPARSEGKLGNFYHFYVSSEKTSH
jgi:hypothetical protein